MSRAGRRERATRLSMRPTSDRLRNVAEPISPLCMVDHMIRQSRHYLSPRARRARTGFTLIELLVVIAILSVLMSILLTTLSKVRRTATSVLCQTKLRSVSQRFTLFADSHYQFLRTDGDKCYSSLFGVNDFQLGLYGQIETRDTADEGETVIGLERSKEPLMCPAGPDQLFRRLDHEMHDGGIFPLRNVSLGFNGQLFGSAARVGESLATPDFALTPKVLDYPLVPLVLDVDGERAENKGFLPFYTAPDIQPGGEPTPGISWFPSRRHDGKIQAAFIGGHVATSFDPLNEPGWNWRWNPASAGVRSSPATGS